MQEGVPNHSLVPRVLGILLTSKCNITCRHCCNHSHPTAEQTAEVADLDRLINAATDIPSVTDIGFSGGEPMIKLDLLLAGVRQSAAHGFAVAVTTNGFWGRSNGAARMMAQLRDAGLSTLWISTSAFHQEFVPLETVVAAARAALASGIEVNLNVVASAGFSDAPVRVALGDVAEHVGITVMPCLPAGRAGHEVGAGEYGPTEAVPFGNCRRHFAKMAVDLDGTVFPCCSPGGFTAPLRLGNARATPLAEIVAGANANPLVAILEEVGPAFFLPFLRSSDAAAELPDSFADQCHLCHAMLSSPRAAAVVAAACNQLAADLAQTAPDQRPATRVAAATHA